MKNNPTAKLRTIPEGEPLLNATGLAYAIRPGRSAFPRVPEHLDPVHRRTPASRKTCGRSGSATDRQPGGHPRLPGRVLISGLPLPMPEQPSSWTSGPEEAGHERRAPLAVGQVTPDLLGGAAAAAGRGPGAGTPSTRTTMYTLHSPLRSRCRRWSGGASTRDRATYLHPDPDRRVPSPPGAPPMDVSRGIRRSTATSTTGATRPRAAGPAGPVPGTIFATARSVEEVESFAASCVDLWFRGAEGERMYLEPCGEA